MRWDDDFWGGYPPSKPIKVEGGIKAKSHSGSIGSTWWSKRWVSVLESFGWTNRLERGRRYARGGQVLDFSLSTGKVTARVQGSMPKPYSVRIEIKPLTEASWKVVEEEMSQKAIFIAKLLAGEMPQNIEEAFNAVNIPLFPKSRKDLKTDCSCPDVANPCKHIAAVYYILAEEFDRDPFMLFKLRGKTKEELTSSLRKKRTTNSETPTEHEVPPSNEPTKHKQVIRLEDFWSGQESAPFPVNIAPPSVQMPIVKRLGKPEFWDSKEDFNKKMSKFYEQISKRAIENAYQEKPNASKTKK